MGLCGKFVFLVDALVELLGRHLQTLLDSFGNFNHRAILVKIGECFLESIGKTLFAQGFHLVLKAVFHHCKHHSQHTLFAVLDTAAKQFYRDLIRIFAPIVEKVAHYHEHVTLGVVWLFEPPAS